MPGTNTTPTEIRAFLSDHLAPFKIPQQIFLKTKIPKGDTGKPLRRQLAEAAADRIPNVVPASTLLQTQILEIWQRLLGRTDIGIDEDFFEAGGDSLLAVQMVCEVEAIIRERIPSSALRSVYTVRELAAAVEHGLPRAPELVTRAKDGSGKSFLFCHGDFATRGFYALKLAEMLTCNQPVHLIHPHPDPKHPIEEAARARLPDVLAAQPIGAFRLGGYCNGGLLAWEIAYQLECIGREVEAVVLVDTMSVNARPDFRAIAKLLGSIAAVAPKRVSEKLKVDGMRAVWGIARGTWSFWRTGKSNWNNLFSRGLAMPNYVPPKLKTRVLCLLSEQGRTNLAYSTMPWINLAPEVDTEFVAGTHLTCITTHIGDIARRLDSLLKQPQEAV
jgi:thioesterase domain-containing protein/acyl carrier protein